MRKRCICQRDQIQAVFDSVTATWGAPHIVAHIAGAGVIHHYLDIKDEDWNRVIDINLTGTFLSIVMMASTNGLVGEEDLAASLRSKAIRLLRLTAIASSAIFM